MTPFDGLMAQLSAVVPFAAHVGVAIETIGEGTASDSLDQSQATSSHVATMYAGALFMLAEAASGAAMAGLFLERLAGVRPVAARSTIDFLRPARGAIRAEAQVEAAKPALFAALDGEGRVRFPVSTAIIDAENREVAKMVVEWHVSGPAAAA